LLAWEAESTKAFIDKSVEKAEKKDFALQQKKSENLVVDAVLRNFLLIQNEREFFEENFQSTLL
jgi:hypothetical protein